MSRRIVLEMAEDADAKFCGSCPMKVVHNCMVFGVQLRSSPIVGQLRAPECLAAERQAERMVEIAPEDAAYFGTLLRGFAIYTGDPDRLRVFAESLREHARKAKR